MIGNFSDMDDDDRRKRLGSLGGKRVRLHVLASPIRKDVDTEAADWPPEAARDFPATFPPRLPGRG